jgi:peptidoglycan-associated lipoprotein
MSEFAGDPSVTLSKTFVLTATLAALLGACSSAPVVPAAPAAPAAPAPAPAPQAVTPATPATPSPAPATKPVASTALPAHLDAKSEISLQRSIYFDFDDQVIKAEFVSVVERHGKYLLANPALAVRLEGNADERGSPEYNLALGQRRAESVRKALKVLGVKDSQMEALSWGEERPAAAGHDEAAWSKNRRVDIQYPAK